MKKQILNRLPIFIMLLLLFSCTKDLETPTQVPTPHSERSTAQFYNQTTTIDINILSSLKQDTLFNEYVCFLDYTYLLHLTDSLRKTTNNEKEFHANYQDIMQKRSGTLKERFVKTKEHYPKDFYKYVIYESKLKRDNSKTKNADIDDVIVDGSEEVYAKMANCYNSIYRAFLSLADQSFRLYSSKIKECPYREYLSHERLVSSTIDALGIGISSIYYAQVFSDNFTHPIKSADVRMVIEEGYLERMTVNELRKESEICVGLITNVLTWNANFELYFVIGMSCYESHDSGGTTGGGGGSIGGGTTNPPTNPNTETEVEKSIKQNAPKASKIINLKSDLTIEQWKEIEEIFENMISIDKIIEKIKVVGGDNIINLKIDANNDSQTLGWDISLKSISYSNVAEEFFHAYQRACDGPPTNANRLNREFEAKFYTLASEHISIGGTNSFPFPEGECNDIFVQWFDTNFEDFDAGRPVSKMDDSDYNRMMQLYKENAEPPYNSMEYEPNYGFDLALDLFLK